MICSALEASYPIAGVQVIDQLLPEPGLRLGIVVMGGIRNGNSNGVGGCRWFSSAEDLDDPGTLEFPFDQETIRRQSTVQGAAGDSVQVGNVVTRNSAEDLQVEVGISGLHRIEGPLDYLDTAVESIFALS